MTIDRFPMKENGQPYNVMIVDDSQVMRMNLQRIMQGFGVAVFAEAGSGKQALELYRKFGSKPDIITMDLTMSGGGGMEAIEAIIKENPEQNIVVVSADGKREIVRQAIVKGAKHFLVKPFSREDVSNVLKGVLGIV